MRMLVGNSSLFYSSHRFFATHALPTNDTTHHTNACDNTSVTYTILPVLPGIGAPNWFYLVLLSPYAGIYYWRSGDRVDDMKIKLATNDDDTMNEITIEGNDEEIERIWRTLNLQEKGMVRVEGIMG